MNLYVANFDTMVFVDTIHHLCMPIKGLNTCFNLVVYFTFMHATVHTVVACFVSPKTATSTYF
jgi:hypothetical protein